MAGDGRVGEGVLWWMEIQLESYWHKVVILINALFVTLKDYSKVIPIPSINPTPYKNPLSREEHSAATHTI